MSYNANYHIIITQLENIIPHQSVYSHSLGSSNVIKCYLMISSVIQWSLSYKLVAVKEGARSIFVVGQISYHLYWETTILNSWYNIYILGQVLDITDIAISVWQYSTQINCILHLISIKIIIILISYINIVLKITRSLWPIFY